MKNNQPSKTDSPPPDLSSKQIELLPPVIMDTVPFGSKFGDVLTDASSVYSPGQTVVIKFRSGNPRNNQKLGDTYLRVELQKWFRLGDRCCRFRLGN
eukprot:UN20339